MNNTMTNNALVLLWKGNTIPDYLVEKVAEVLITNGVCIPEMLTIKYSDEEEIAKVLIKGTEKKFGTIPPNSSEAVKNAVIYIGTRFKNSLTGTNGTIDNTTAFAIELSNAVTIAQRNRSFIGVGSKDELLTAIEIIATVRATVPNALVKKYHFTTEVVDVIGKVYENYMSITN